MFNAYLKLLFLKNVFFIILMYMNYDICDGPV